ncbi:MAG: hypothetical protein COB15_12365, partial [Flavobacteriales bacterium]
TSSSTTRHRSSVIRAEAAPMPPKPTGSMAGLPSHTTHLQTNLAVRGLADPTGEGRGDAAAPLHLMKGSLKSLHIIAGDYNSDLQKKNKAADSMKDFLDQIDYITTAQSKNVWDPTWSREGKCAARSTIDYVALPRRFASACETMRVVEPPISTDHKAVIVTLRVKWKDRAKRRKLIEKEEKPDYGVLGWNLNWRKKYSDAFGKKFKLLEQQQRTAKQAFECIRATAMEVGDDILPKNPGRPGLKSVIPGLKPAFEVLEERCKALENLGPQPLKPNRQLTEEEKQLDKQRKELAVQAKTRATKEAETLLKNYIKRLGKGDPFFGWQHVFALKKEEVQRRPENLTEEKLTEHWGHVLCKEPPATKVQLPQQKPWERLNQPAPVIDTSDIILEEVEAAAKTQKNHKSPGKDELPVEVLKCKSVQIAMLPLLNAALRNTEDIPPQFYDALIVALHKKGDVEDPMNYRGISLMSCVAKLFHLILMRRIREALDPFVSPEQNAYRPGRSCQQHIVAAAVLYQTAANYKNYPLHMLFVDFSKAFDSVDRGAMREILLWWNIPGSIVDVLMAMLENHCLYVKHQGKVSDSYTKPTSGVLQGDTLAPYLFILCMDIVLQQLDQSLGAKIENERDERDAGGKIIDRGTDSRPGPPVRRLPSLGYSDDVCLLSNGAGDMQKLFTQFEQLAKGIGMTINMGKGKTEEIRINSPGGPAILNERGEPIPQVKEYKYLGTMLGQSWEADFRRRKSLGWGVFREYKYIWHSACDMDLKKKLFQALIEPILVYGAFTYPRGDNVASTLHSAHAKFLRACLGLPRADPTKPYHLSTEWLYYGQSKLRGKSHATATLTLPAAVLRQRLSSLGHWVRDHYHRLSLPGEEPRPLRRHPVIDVLRFDPSQYNSDYTMRSKAFTVRDAYQSAIPHGAGPRGGEDKYCMKKHVLTSTDTSDCRNKHSWYNTCKHRCQEEDQAILLPIMKRRMEDKSRVDFGRKEYGKAKKILVEDYDLFTQRHLTQNIRENPIGEERQYLARKILPRPHID